VAGDPATVIATGTGTSTTPVSPIVGTGSNTVVDANVTLQSHAGAPGALRQRGVPHGADPVDAGRT
jgi:hypothetical protein